MGGTAADGDVAGTIDKCRCCTICVHQRAGTGCPDRMRAASFQRTLPASGCEAFGEHWSALQLFVCLTP
eukprot:1161464-Pelagomonas_calceolata.AAC.7